MAAQLRAVCLLLLLPLALADTQLPCEGFEVVEGMGMDRAQLEYPSQIGVKILETTEEAEEDCWAHCCHRDNCSMATMSGGKCHLIRCTFQGFNMCELSQQQGTRSLRKVNIGVQPKQEDFCLPEAETGKCKASFTRWWYDPKTETCKNFTYGGCPVNLNNHIEEEECMKKCSGVQAVETINIESPPKRLVAASSRVGFCTDPKEVGRCRAAFPRWYFDAESMCCHSFTYGGCGGNKNNYMTEQDCLNKCVVAHDDDDEGSIDNSILHHPIAAVVLPILLAILVAALLGAMIMFFVKVAKKNRQNANLRAMWHPIDDKECLVNSAYTL
ncbi:kunitz-type protease inhibitor 2 [Pseudophryne corroboree]|uniref:kunitz-type protease inhibitor 2 n=1 Tax=Pseudophryne corroboree TaxID=495146 RepID=UPI00308179DB